QQPAADQGTDDPDEEIADEPEAGAPNDLACKPSSDQADHQNDQETFTRHRHWYPPDGFRRRPPVTRGYRPARRSIGTSSAVEVHQLVGEALLLLLVEARVERLGSIGELLHVGGTVAEKLRTAREVFDQVTGLLLRCPIGLRGDLPLGARLAGVTHRTLEAGPVLLLLRSEAQIGLDPRDAHVLL